MFSVNLALVSSTNTPYSMFHGVQPTGCHPHRWAERSSVSAVMQQTIQGDVRLFSSLDHLILSNLSQIKVRVEMLPLLICVPHHVIMSFPFSYLLFVAKTYGIFFFACLANLRKECQGLECKVCIFSTSTQQLLDNKKRCCFIFKAILLIDLAV